MKIRLSFIGVKAYKSRAFTLPVGFVAAALSIQAQAVPVNGQISLAGYAAPIGSTGFGAATGIDFVQGVSGAVSTNVVGGITSYGAGSRTFAGLSCANLSGACGSIKDLPTFTGGAISNFLTLDTGTATLIMFDLANISNITRDTVGNTITLRATGTINVTGFDSTAGILALTASGDDINSFSATLLTSAATTPSVPEPATWAMMTLGFGAVGFAMRRKKVISRIRFA